MLHIFKLVFSFHIWYFTIYYMFNFIMVEVLMQISTCEFVWLVQYLMCGYLSSYNNTNSVKHSDWIIITWSYKWNILQGHKTGHRKKTQRTWTSEWNKPTRQLNFTRQIQRTTIQNRNSYVDSTLICDYVYSYMQLLMWWFLWQV